jgi:uncharacterized PurR-regulated membrane protein YhhQ (DUF165 family)
MKLKIREYLQARLWAYGFFFALAMTLFVVKIFSFELAVGVFFLSSVFRLTDLLVEPQWREN